MVNLAEWSVEAVRAGERATAYRESNRRRIERRSSAIARPVDQGNTVERIGEGPKRVLWNLAEFLDPQISYLGVRPAVFDGGQQLRHRLLAFSPTDNVDGRLLDHLGKQRGMGSPHNNGDVKMLLDFGSQGKLFSQEWRHAGETNQVRFRCVYLAEHRLPVAHQVHHEFVASLFGRGVEIGRPHIRGDLDLRHENFRHESLGASPSNHKQLYDEARACENIPAPPGCDTGAVTTGWLLRRALTVFCADRMAIAFQRQSAAPAGDSP